MKAIGVNGAMELRGDTIIITRKLFYGKSKGEKAVRIHSISAVQFKPSGLTSGYLQLAFSGSGESKAGWISASNDENTIMFTKRTQADFEALRDAIEEIRDAKAAPTSPTSIADEIAKLAGLRDAGALSDEEFQAAKARLIG